MTNDNMITLRKSIGHLKILREFLDSKGGYFSLGKLCCELTHKNGGEYQPQFLGEC